MAAAEPNSQITILYDAFGADAAMKKDLNRLRGELLLRSSHNQPQSRSLKGIETGIGLLPDGSLNIFVPGRPPARWFEVHSQTGELVFVRVEYNVNGSPKYPVELEKFDFGPETEDSLEIPSSEWTRNGHFLKKKFG